MKTIIFSVFFFVLIYTSVFSQEKTVKVEIDFGNDKEIISKKVSKEQSITALEALQLAATVETHAVGSYVFVTSINNIKANYGKTAWYYKVNGESSKVLAINNNLKDGDVLRWILKEDVCSKTVDKD
ncbi:MAG: DUF4430 domain-containing protein [Chloroflexia bacterium]|nr:DUF4430 domain-containing protein [Chloroflexia bacterium]